MLAAQCSTEKLLFKPIQRGLAASKCAPAKAQLTWLPFCLTTIRCFKLFSPSILDVSMKQRPSASDECRRRRSAGMTLLHSTRTMSPTCSSFHLTSWYFESALRVSIRARWCRMFTIIILNFSSFRTPKSLMAWQKIVLDKLGPECNITVLPEFTTNGASFRHNLTPYDKMQLNPCWWSCRFCGHGTNVFRDDAK